MKRKVILIFLTQFFFTSIFFNYFFLDYEYIVPNSILTVIFLAIFLIVEKKVLWKDWVYVLPIVLSLQILLNILNFAGWLFRSGF